MNVELSVVVPTFNECDNVVPLFERLREVLAGIAWEVIFVDDDSPDRTADTVRELGRRYPNVRCIHRVGRRGLSSACIEGMTASSASCVAVMDADFQHDEALLVPMLEALHGDALDIVVGSRYMKGGSTGEWDKRRRLMSRFATWLGRLLVRCDLTDPMSGFFMLRRDFFLRTVRGLSGKGFKILLDLCASAAGPVRVKELPYTFRSRRAGESKLGAMVLWEYLSLLLDKSVGRWVPVRFFMFILVGLGGVVIHLTTLGCALTLLSIPFGLSQTLATFLAMTMNFVCNNLFTYSDVRLKGVSFFSGLLTFYLACSIGAVINVLTATALYRLGIYWWIAGFAGALTGSVWNYVTTSMFTWQGSPAKQQECAAEAQLP